MANRVRLVLALHNHQPIGNFDGVCEAAYQDSYRPFLDVLAEFPEIVISLHLSGCLLDWLVEHHPEYIDRVASLVDRGQIEILGGPYYEPILASIPRRDRLGQIVEYSARLEELFRRPVRGMWVPERVWEQSFVGDVTQAGIEATILDDHHFRSAGLVDDELHGYYLTEDEGRLLRVFPGSERLRYTIPFADPSETIHYLRQVGERCPDAVVTFGDDGEKFGTWPGTREPVYAGGWLRRFFEALRQHGDWLIPCRLSDVIDQVPPVGKVYIPDGSYREMTEWSLPLPRQEEYHRLTAGWDAGAGGDTALARRFARGGFWRNFRVKYPESNEMTARMLQVSARLADLEQQEPDAPQQRDLDRARQELYRAQCNCPYWHGAFGGLYLPHLRNAVYRNLIEAETRLERVAGRGRSWCAVDASDYNLDGRKEVRLAGDRLVAYFTPARGGHLYELDVRSIAHNLLATLNRRPELYHQAIVDLAAHTAAEEPAGHDGAAEARSIHHQATCKQPDLHRRLIYDRWPRKGCVDHFLQPGLTLERFRQGEGSIGDFTLGAYAATIRQQADRCEVRMHRQGNVGPYRCTVTKSVCLRAGGSRLEFDYWLDELPRGVPLHFGVEFNLAGMAAGASDRYFYDSRGATRGPLETALDLQGMDRVGVVDEWLGLDVALEFSHPAGVWAVPIETISQSEGGYEAVFQSTAIVPHWEFTAPETGSVHFRVSLVVDTSAAQARKLLEIPAPALAVTGS